MKTKAQWDQSRQNLSTFLNVGDLVDEEMKMYFLEVLPPATWTNRVIQIGEPYSHNSKNQPEYFTLERDHEGWKYAGIKAGPEVM